MFQGRFALAAASALILSGCAAAPWQRPADHPADPGAAAGVVQPVTALERYRSTAAPESGTTEDAQPHSHGETSR
jgi:hypothetical protein